MSLTLKTYPEYKASALKSLGRIPSHWLEVRAKYLFREVDDRSVTGAEEMLSVSHITGVTPRSEKTVTMFMAESNVGHKRCREKDLVINTMWAWMGALGVSRYSGLVSPSYGVYRRFDDKTDPLFLDALLRTSNYVGEYTTRSTGVNSSRLRLYPERFLSLPILLPPTDEQIRISLFIRRFSVRIQTLIRAKRRVTELLKEQKQAVIHRAVTRGIAPNSKLKPSGISWLGKIPCHWEVMRTKFLAHIKTGGRDTIDRIDNAPYPFFVRSQTVERIDTYTFDGEAVLTAGDGAGVAKVFHYIDGKFDYHQRVYKFSDFRRIAGRFFFFYLQATLRFEALDASAKSTVDSLRLPLLQNFPTVIPPREEQLAIVSAIETETTAIDRAISRILQDIQLLREYRTRLIADVVTGKLDVRGVELPELDDFEEIGDAIDGEPDDYEELDMAEEAVTD